MICTVVKAVKLLNKFKKMTQVTVVNWSYSYSLLEFEWRMYMYVIVAVVNG